MYVSGQIGMKSPGGTLGLLLAFSGSLLIVSPIGRRLPGNELLLNLWPFRVVNFPWVNIHGIPFWLVGEFTPVGTYFSGWTESDAHWGYDLGFDPRGRVSGLAQSACALEVT